MAGGDFHIALNGPILAQIELYFRCIIAQITGTGWNTMREESCQYRNCSSSEIDMNGPECQKDGCPRNFPKCY